jgi:putative NADH-flavin reductase
MRLAILGASGGVGKHLCRFAAEARHETAALVRPATPFEAPAGIRVVRGEALDQGALEEVLAGGEVVISSLGIQRANPKNPWSPLTSPPDFCSATARMIVSVMKAHGIRRIVAVSAAGVGESAAQMNLLMKFMVARTNIGVAYRDLAVMEDVYREAERDFGLDWMCPRPTRLTHGPRTDRVKIVDAFTMSSAISRADVAAWMLARIADPEPLAPRLPQITGA